MILMHEYNDLMLRLLYFCFGIAVGAIAPLSAFIDHVDVMEAASIHLAGVSYYKACIESSGKDCRKKAQIHMNELTNIKARLLNP